MEELNEANAEAAENVAKLTPQAEAGDAEAQLELARAYWAMVVMAKSDIQETVKETSWSWYEKVVEQTKDLKVKAEATKELATNYWYQEKMDGLQSLAEKGVADAQYYLADRLSSSNETMKQAIEWYEKAAENGKTESMAWLASNFQLGMVVEQDVKKAFEWLKKGAEAGDPEMTYELATKYHNGFGSFWPEFEKDIRKANELYQKAANAGHTGAQIYLAKLLIYAKLGANAEVVTGWLLDKEVAEGYFYRGRMYELGIGRDMNLDKALAHYQVALKKGYLQAEMAIDRVKVAKMNAAEAVNASVQ